MNSICKLKVFSEIHSACYQVHCCCSKTKCPLSLSPDYNLRGELSHGISQSLYSPSPCDPNVGLTRTYGMTLLIKPLGSALRAKVAPLPGGPYCSASGSWRKLSVHPCAVACGSWRAGWKVWERRACYVCRVMKPNSFNANKKKEKVWGKRESSYPWPSEEMWAQGSHAIAPLMYVLIHPQHRHLLPRTPPVWNIRLWMNGERVEDTADFPLISEYWYNSKTMPASFCNGGEVPPEHHLCGPLGNWTGLFLQVGMRLQTGALKGRKYTGTLCPACLPGKKIFQNCSVER